MRGRFLMKKESKKISKPKNTAEYFILDHGDDFDLVNVDNYLDKHDFRASATETKRKVDEEKANKPSEPKPLSYAMASDEFSTFYEEEGLVKPLYDFNRLARLMELDTFHNRCVQQKATDLVELGYDIEPFPDVNEPDVTQLNIINDFIKKAPERGSTFIDVCKEMAIDYWSLANSQMEVGRNGKLIPSLIAHIPMKTVRYHQDKLQICQIRKQDKVWFDVFEPDRMTPSARHEAIIFRDFSVRSSYYGLPCILPAISAILGIASAKEFNLKFFDNNAIPAYVVIVKNAEMSEKLKDAIKYFFRREVKGNPHQTLMLNLQKVIGTEGDASIEFKALATEVKEASFKLFRKDMRDEILIAHGIPGYHVDVIEIGALGENVANKSIENYRDSVIEPKQRALEEKINLLFEEVVKKTFITLGKTFERMHYVLKFKDIDLSDPFKLAEMAEKLVKAYIMTINDARKMIGIPKLGQWADKIYIFSQTGAIMVGGKEETEIALTNVDAQTGQLAKIAFADFTKKKIV